MERKDFLLENNVLVIRGNDLVIATSDQQHIQDILNAFAGWYREFPLIGAGASSYINAPANKIAEFEAIAKVQLRGDGYTETKIIVNQLTADAQDIQIYNG